MIALYTVSEIRQIEQAALATLPPGTLMQRAGQAAAHAALTLLSHQHQDGKVLILAGPGNNGGDALEAAHCLLQAGLSIYIVLHADATALPADAHAAFQHVKNSAACFLGQSDLLNSASDDWQLVIDGLFGIGLARPISDAIRTTIEQVNGFACPVLAIDVPSGLDADTGNIVGPNGIAVRATHTITFIADKPGLHTCHGRDYAGDVTVTDLHIEYRHFLRPNAFLNDVELFEDRLHRRLHNSHKGSYGDTVVTGGARGMSGAPILAARAAAKCGAGRVFAAFVDEAPAYDSGQPELMCRLASEINLPAATRVIGPGLGTTDTAIDLLAKALEADAPLVLDADALNLIAANSSMQQKLLQRKCSALITPHPLEAARLLGVSSTAVQADRLAAARMLSSRYQVITILKGSGTVIAHPDGRAVINTTGNPALATAGAGDVLAGICGALLAQDYPLWEAALAAVWLHGYAADELVRHGIGPIGLTAGELIPAVRTALNQLTGRRKSLRQGS
ncbi:MAG TPA: NAD(P)H-hydrate dehydratase [Burkholderiaceae bacterium]|nr:NAD(P)H-hydrate dehydratase [Burkholderiaceae bacterium]